MKSFKVIGSGVAVLAVVAVAATANVPSVSRNTLVPEGTHHYAPSVIPDRIILIPTATPESSQTVNWRTDGSLDQAVAEIAKATNHPGIHMEARAVEGTSQTLTSNNGNASHHSVTFDNLEADTLYAYRVKGGNTWSEWFQFRTAKAEFEPHEILYFGDAQNAVKSHFSRVLRQAQRVAPEAALMIHAGDLVNGRDGVHDDEWGEWFDAGGWLYGMTNQLVTPGNHEYIKEQPEGPRILMPHWDAQFSVPDNGPEGMKDSVYFVDYQGVRYIALDSQAALQDDANAQLQTQWLEDVLKNNKARWTIVVHHHPTFSVSRGRDNPLLRELWQPLYEKYGVDLVFQGHDHTYGRGRSDSSDRGPVYVVSVAGPKMYRVSETAETNMDRTAEDRQLFQVISFEKNRLSYRSLTATGELYDAFDLVRKRKGAKLEDYQPNTNAARCGNPHPPKEHRCWNGTELINSTVPLH